MKKTLDIWEQGGIYSKDLVQFLKQSFMKKDTTSSGTTKLDPNSTTTNTTSFLSSGNVEEQQQQQQMSTGAYSFLLLFLLLLLVKYKRKICALSIMRIKRKHVQLDERGSIWTIWIYENFYGRI